MVMRLAVLYAVLDGSSQVQLTHLQSAEALWRYCEGSARFLFGARDQDGRSTDTHKLLQALQQAGADGLSRAAIFRRVFQCNTPRSEIDAMCATLRTGGYASMQERPGRTRSSVWWFYRSQPSNKT
jgi:hypothetical protein